MHRTAARRPIAPGRRLYGRYKVERRLGRGGSAEVWLAHDDRLDRTVAIKAPLPEALPNETARDRFVAEARAAAGLSHPAIVPIYDVVQDPSMPAIVLRYVEGETLAERIARTGPMAPAEAAAVGAELAGALAHAHAAGLVHRDVKPGNVLVDEAGRAQLLDFGIAGSLGEPPAEGRPAEVTGTLRYMAPEQVRGGSVDARSDLYALGLVLYELLAGRPAFEPATPEALAAAQVAGPSPLPDGVPAPLRHLGEQLLAVDPADRPADAATVEGRLRTLAEATSSTPAAPARVANVPPTIAPGLPAVSAGLALLAGAPDPSITAPRPGDPASARATDTAGETAALPIAVTAAIAPVADRTPVPRRSPAKPTILRDPRPPVAALAAGVAALVVAAVVLAAGLGNPATNRAAADSSGGASQPAGIAPSPTANAVAPAPPKSGPKDHRGHGHGKG